MSIDKIIKSNLGKFQNVDNGKCVFCTKILPKRPKLHSNIGIIHKFCSNECKNEWCYSKQTDLQKNKK